MSTLQIDGVVESTVPLVAHYDGRTIVIQRRVNFQHVLISLKNIFGSLEQIETERIFIMATFPDNGDEKIEVSSDAWAELVPNLSEIWIEVREQPSDGHILVRLTTTLRGGAHRNFDFRCNPTTTTIGKLMETFVADAHVCADDYRPMYGGRRLCEDEILTDLGIEDGDSIDLFPALRGRKPVIYLFSPRALAEINVRLSLVPSWKFSMLYPSTAIVRSGDVQTVSWTVSAKPDGTLTDKATNVDVSYLFWEAHVEPKCLTTPSNSRPSTPTGRLTPFDPAFARNWLTPESSVVIPIAEVPVYLDAALKALTLHTEARTSFITYWLPFLLRHAHVALRFLPQEAYEESAPMSIEPKPDVVTRVFMIFHGISESDEKWAEARTRASQNVEGVWRDAVGVDAGRALDSSLFRVLEWGGMELHV